MPKKYHIHTQPAPMDMKYICKFNIIRQENCINCGRCTKVCIYEAHKRRSDDIRIMADPNTTVCRNCFRCIQECPRGALIKSIDRSFTGSGGAYWKPDMLISLFKQAEDGKVPVTGAGYRGPFTGPGFDGMWTDMSEIVRPTRDGIHGREYISTSVELGRKLNHLKFDENGKLLSSLHEVVDIPIPVIFEQLEKNVPKKVRSAMLRSAIRINTLMIIPADEISPEYEKHMKHIIPHTECDRIDAHMPVLKKARIISLEYSAKLLNNFTAITEKIKKSVKAPIIIRIPAVEDVEAAVFTLVHSGAEVIQIVADYRGNEQKSLSDQKRRHLKDIIRTVHLKLVDEKIRDEVSLIASGGIAMAENVPKAMLCGADLTAIDIPPMIALGASILEGEKKKIIFPKELEKIPSRILVQRIINLMGAWHSQILEMMGAMGIREARRLRGETGRAIFFEDIDGDTFGKIFKQQEGENA